MYKRTKQSVIHVPASIPFLHSDISVKAAHQYGGRVLSDIDACQITERSHDTSKGLGSTIDKVLSLSVI